MPNWISVAQLNAIFMKSSFLTLSLALALGLTGYWIGRSHSANSAAATSTSLSAASTSRTQADSIQNLDSSAHKFSQGKSLKSTIRKAASPQDRIQALQKITDPMERTRQWLLLVDSLKPEQFEAFVAAYRAEGIPPERMSEYAVLLSAWAKVDPQGALDYASKNTGNPFARQTILATWAGYDPNSAIAWAKSNHQGDGGNPWMVGVIKGIAFQNPELASSLLQEMPRSVERGEALNQLLPALLDQKGLAETRDWVLKLPDAALKEGAMMRLAERTVQQDPQGTADWLIAHPSQATNRMVDDALYVLASQNRDAAQQYFQQLPAGEIRSNALRGIVNATAIAAPQEAIALMNAYPKDVSDRMVEQFVWHSFRQDPAAAVSQISRLTNPQEQERMYSRTLSWWMERDPKAALDWANRNPLPDKVVERLNKNLPKN